MAKRLATLMSGRPFVEFCVRGPAVSAQAKGLKGRERLKLWKGLVSEAARLAVASDVSPSAESVEVHLSEFSDFATKDRDNMAKPILDAMQGIVYENDRQVQRVHIEWCDINGAYMVRSMSSVVAQAMTEGYEFVWIRLYRHVPRQALL